MMISNCPARCREGCRSIPLERPRPPGWYFDVKIGGKEPQRRSGPSFGGKISMLAAEMVAIAGPNRSRSGGATVV